MKTIFLGKNGIWIAVLFTGIVLVVAGLYQLALGLYGLPGSREAGPPTVGTQAGTTEPGTPPAKSPAGQAKNGERSEERKDLKAKHEFFVEYRLERDRTRSQQIDLLREIVNNQNSSEESRKEANRRLLAISQAIDTEMKIENLIRAENFKDAVAFVQEKSATIIVQTPALTPMDKNKLTDIAVRVTGLTPENIVVIPKV